MPRPLRVTSRSPSPSGMPGGTCGKAIAGAHDVLDVQQKPPAERAGGMGSREILLGEAARLEQRDRQRIAHRERRRRACGGGEVQRARLGGNADVQVHRGDPRECRARIAGEGDQRDAEPLDRRHDGQDLVGFARIGQRQHRILAGDHADIAVARLAGVHEERRGTGARERGGELAADMPRFAHSRDDDAAAAVKTNPASECKLVSQAGQLRAQAVDFDGERGAPELDEALIRVVKVHRRMIQLEETA